LRADALFIRTQSTVRADGPPSAQVSTPQFDFFPPASFKVGARSLRAARANRVFSADEKHIRRENAVTVNTKHDVRG
jgi:hypothetical protein